MTIAESFEAQKEFFYSGKTLNIDFRIQQLKKLKNLIESNEESIAKALYSDLGKSHFEAFSTEIGFVIEEINLSIKKLYKWAQPESYSSPIWMWPSDAKVVHEPYGVTLIIAPWNYPFQLLIAPLVGAMIAGNTAVLKPSELTPATEKLLVDLFAESFDDEYIKVISGGVEETTELLALPFDFIFFTGSTQVGKIVMRAASEHLTPVCLELGGKSPCLIERSADLDVAAKRLVWGKFMNAGQTCVAPDYVLVPDDLYDVFMGKMKKVMQEFYGETSADRKASKYFGRIVNERHHQRLCSYFKAEDVIFGGETDESEKYIGPTLLGPLDFDHPVMQEEIFGPLLPIIKYKDFDATLKVLSRRDKPLAFYLFTSDANIKQKVVRNIPFGGGGINECLLHLANPNLPFGGVGASGLGRYHGKYSFETFSHKKAVLDHATWLDPNLRYPPYTEQKFKITRKLLT